MPRPVSIVVVALFAAASLANAQPKNEVLQPKADQTLTIGHRDYGRGTDLHRTRDRHRAPLDLYQRLW